MADLPATALKPVVREWHKAALAHIGTKPFEETWIDFLRAWPRVKFPANGDFMAEIFRRAAANPVGDYDDEKIRVLAAMCRELQAAAGDNAFFLATRTAGKLLEVDRQTVGRWLFLLEQEGLIQTVEKGGKGKAAFKATRFRYTG